MLKEQIKEDLKTAMKASDATAKTTLSMLLSAIKNRELDKRGKLAKEGISAQEAEERSALTDEEALEAVSSELKKRRESIGTYEDAGRAELAESEKKEAEILSRYLPEQMKEEEVRTLVREAIERTGAASPKDMGTVMGQVSPKTKGRFDGARLAHIVKELLNG
jgi:hypothetical protein